MPPRRSGHHPHQQRRGPHLEEVKRTRLVKKNFSSPRFDTAPNRKPPHRRTDDRSDPDHDCLNVITGEVLSAAPALAM